MDIPGYLRSVISRTYTIFLYTINLDGTYHLSFKYMHTSGTIL